MRPHAGYRLVEDVLPGDLVDQLCAVHLEGDENWEDILLQGHNQGGGRRQTAPGTVNKWLPSEIKWRLLRILADLFPVRDDLEDREPRLVERMDAPPWRGYQWPHRDFMLTLRGAADTRVVFVSLQDDPCKLHRGRAMATTRPTRGMWSRKSGAVFC